MRNQLQLVKEQIELFLQENAKQAFSISQLRANPSNAHPSICIDNCLMLMLLSLCKAVLEIQTCSVIFKLARSLPVKQLFTVSFPVCVCIVTTQSFLAGSALATPAVVQAHRWHVYSTDLQQTAIMHQ